MKINLSAKSGDRNSTVSSDGANKHAVNTDHNPNSSSSVGNEPSKDV